MSEHQFFSAERNKLANVVLDYERKTNKFPEKIWASYANWAAIWSMQNTCSACQSESMTKKPLMFMGAEIIRDRRLTDYSTDDPGPFPYE